MYDPSAQIIPTERDKTSNDSSAPQPRRNVHAQKTAVTPSTQTHPHRKPSADSPLSLRRGLDQGDEPEESSCSYARLEIGDGEISYYTNCVFNGPAEESKYDMIYMANADSMAEEKEYFDSYHRENPQEYISYNCEIKDGVLYVSYVCNVT